MKTLRLSLLSISLLAVVSGPSPAAADCVHDLRQCADRCDTRFKPGDPARPTCARGCATRYPACEKRALQVAPAAPPPAKKVQ
jgi:hypothetical protein